MLKKHIIIYKNMKKIFNKKIFSYLELEDWTAIIFVVIVGVLNIYNRLIHNHMLNIKPLHFYYFLLPLILIIFKEAFILLFKDNYKYSNFLKIFRDWFPFMLLISLYYSLYNNLNMLLSINDKDHLLAYLDDKIFGIRLSVWFERFIDIPYLTDWLSFSYFFFIFIPPIVVGYIYVKGLRWQFKVIMYSLIIMEVFGCLGYLMVPAVGPQYAFKEWYTKPLYGSVFVDWVNQVVNFARLPRDAFPSLHVGISALMYFFCFRYAKLLFVILSPLVISLWISTIFLRYHYTIDSLAGLILAVIIFFIGIKYLEPYYKKRLS